MPIHKGSAKWHGQLMSGSGHLQLGSGLFDADYAVGNRFGSEPGTNPEELIGAALAACYSMAMSGELGKENFTADEISAEAQVSIDKQGDGFAITHIDLIVNAKIPGLEDEKRFQHIAETVKKNCPVSKALAGAEIRLKATLQV